MPITFTVDHAQRLVLVVATGIVTRETVMRYFDTQRMLDGLSYPRLVDCRDLESQLTAEDWRAVAEWLPSLAEQPAFGPAAVVVDNEETFELVERISTLVSHLCELRAFADRESAEEWLADRLASTSRADGT